MGRNKKKFIEKDKGVKFYLVHRSQKDPLYLDENAGEHVLLPVDDNNNSKRLSDLFSDTASKKSGFGRDDRIAEQQKFGIYFDDDYNYMQHLREVKEEIDVEPEEYIAAGEVDIFEKKPAAKAKLMLPSSVFASEFEEEVGYFNQAAPNNDPKIGWDPEIVETLDDESHFNYEDPSNELDDDFFIKANDDKLVEVKEDENDSDYTDVDEDDAGSSYDSNDNDDDDDDDDDNKSLEKFETKSHFTNYSMTSSVIRRNEKLKYLDDHFERLYSQYSEDQIGGLDIESEDITGYRDTNNVVLQKAFEDFQRATKKIEYVPERKLKSLNEEGEEDEEEEGSEEEDDEDEDEEEYEYIYVKQKMNTGLDCESILSLNSSSNSIKPKIIKAKEEFPIVLSKRSGLPLNVLKEKPISKNKLEKIDHKITRVLPEIPSRSKNESKEEKKERKQLIKEHRRNRRVEKKMNKLAFKEEKLKQAPQISAMSDRLVEIKLN